MLLDVMIIVDCVLNFGKKDLGNAEFLFKKHFNTTIY